jgi:hypothetical protein
MQNAWLKLWQMKDNTLFIGLCLIFLIGYSCLYANYLQKDPVLARDDVLLVLPLKSITSLAGYIEAVKNNTILDFQPIRDLSFYLNVKIIEWTNISTFHVANFSLFILTIFLLMKLIQALGFQRKQVIYSAILYASHPLMVSSVGWISARKHSLALTFLLLFLIDFVKQKQITKRSIIFYVLSILSHQIFILLPVWVFAYSRIKRMDISYGRFLLMSSFGATVLFLGILKTFYLEMGNVTYRYFHWFENISRYVLSVGRSVMQILFPVSISSDYFQGSLLNLAGIPIFILCIFLLYKSKSNKDSLSWIFLGVLSHILTYITFVNDTYLYLPLICVLIAGNFYFTTNPLLLNLKIKNGLMLLCVGLLMGKTISASQMWRSDKDLWHYSYMNERSPFTSILLGTNLLNHDEKTAIDFIVWGANNYDLVSHKSIFLSFLDTIYNSSLPIQKKIQIFKDCYKDHQIYKAVYGLTLLEGTQEQMVQGIGILKPILQKENTYSPDSRGLMVIKRIRHLCQNHNDKNVACHELGITY